MSVEFIWHAEVSVNNEYGELSLYHVNNSAYVTDGTFTDESVQTSCFDWIVNQLDVDPGQVAVVNFTWSSMPRIEINA
jgi:hypothetical protein